MITAEPTAGAGVVAMGRHVGADDLPTVEYLVDQWIMRGINTVVLDFSGTDHVYFKLAFLLERLRSRLREDGKDLVCVGASPYVSDILLAMGFLPDHGCWSDVPAHTDTAVNMKAAS